MSCRDVGSRQRSSAVVDNMCIQMAGAVGAAVKPGFSAHVMLNLTSWRLLEHTTFQHGMFWFSQVATYPSMYDCFQVLDRF